MLKMEKKRGALTIEVAIAIGLAALVLIFTLGLFSENLSAMISNTGMANMFSNNNKTTYGSFNRDYTGSQINVQLIGEQGLAMLRNIANNKAITQIDKYMDGSDKSVINANSIGYLAAVINAIVGSPDICVYMKKDSDKKCDEDGIGGVLYHINLNGNSIAINKNGGMGSTNAAMGGDFTGGAHGFTVRANMGGTVRTFQPMSMLPTTYIPAIIGQTAIYKYIKDLSLFADESNTVYDYDILIKANNAAPSGPGPLPEQIIEAFTGASGLFPTSITSLQTAHDNCTSWLVYIDPEHRYVDLNEPMSINYGGSTDSEREYNCGVGGVESSNHFVSNNEIDSAQSTINTLTDAIMTATGNDDIEMINSIIDSPNFSNMISILQQDHKNDSCETFITNLQQIAVNNGLSGMHVPTCTPNP